MTWANQFSMGDIITVLQVGCVLATFFLASLQFPVSGTPYTYHNGLAMFTADTGQHTALGLALQQLPAKGAAAQSATQPFPLLYGDKITFLNFFFSKKNIPGPSGAATTAMFLPTAGSAAAAQAAAVASVTQQQLQLQTAAATAAHINSINNVAAAAQVIPGFTCFCFSSPKYFGQI